MPAKLISYSKAMSYDSEMDLIETIAYCARVSNPSNQNNTETNEKLLKYLIKHKHWSPFEMVSACIEVDTTRDIARQLLRHRSFSFQEFSQRYAGIRDLNDDFVIREARLQDPKNRQNSVVNEDAALEDEWANKQLAIIEMVKMTYDWAIENGIAKEQARAILPEGNTVSRLYVNGTVRSWIHYIELRSANGTQQEHMDLALAVAEAIGKIYPSVINFIKE